MALKQEKQKIYVNDVGFTMVMIEGNGKLFDYQIGETPVTQELYQVVMGSNPSFFENCPQCPVENVSWKDIQQFIKKLNSLTGQNFRLPTEEEWVYAAKGGNKSQGYKYSGSNNVDEVAWNFRNSDLRTHPVSQKKPNELGLYDMSGNVWEWCEKGKNNNILEVHCGSWYDYPDGCRVALRYYDNPRYRYDFLGFRLAI